MSIIICENISLTYGCDTILENISFAVNEGARVGIIGANGAGKTTLFKIISGEIKPTKGNVYISKGASLGSLEQISDDKVFGGSVYDIALSAHESLLNTERELEALRLRMDGGDEAAIPYYTRLHDSYISLGGMEFRERTRSMLQRFGFNSEMQQSSADLLSGGQKTRLMLVCLLLKDPDIIMLDEPTNHLDAGSVEWLESYIKASKKTFLIVSHDRTFLDNVTTDTVEIEHKVSRTYSGNYTAYREKKRKLDEDRLKHYMLQQKEIQRIKDYIEQQRRWGQERNFANIRNREKMLDRMQLVEKPKSAPKTIKFEISSSGTKSFDVLSVRNITKSYPGLVLFKNLSFEVHYGDRLFITGNNGCGKTTLIKILTGREKQDSGTFETGYNQTIGYYDQDQKLLNNANSVMDELWDAYDEKLPAEIRNILARFGFYGDDVFKPVSVLSGGERARLSIAKMILKGVSLLILDEPTNHLDIPSKEILENALQNFEGTVICVSHDRYFAKALSTRILDIDANKYTDGYRVYECGFERYSELAPEARKDSAAKSDASSKEEYERTKKEKNRKRAAREKLGKLEKSIEQTEKRIKEIDDLMSGEAASDYIKVKALFEEKEEKTKQLEEMYEEYFSLEELTAD